MRRYTGKTVDEVLKNIAKEQDCKVEDITYEVIEEKKHLLGLLSSVTIEAYTQKDVKEFIFDYLGTYFTELNQEVSIEIILRAAVNNTFHKRFNVLVDVGNYKEDRYRKVKRIAQRVAREVRKSHVDAALDPMPNDERKVIHQFLSGMPNIKTESEGEGAHRHLVIKYVSNE